MTLPPRTGARFARSPLHRGPSGCRPSTRRAWASHPAGRGPKPRSPACPAGWPGWTRPGDRWTGPGVEAATAQRRCWTTGPRVWYPWGRRPRSERRCERPPRPWH